MVLTYAQVVAEPASWIELVVQQVTTFGGALLVLAAVAAAIWRWGFKDRWEAAVMRAIKAREGIVETEDTEAMVEALDQWGVGVREHVNGVLGEIKDELKRADSSLKENLDETCERVASLERTVSNGLTDRMARVEAHVERLVEGQARMEGIMQMVVRQGEAT